MPELLKGDFLAPKLQLGNALESKALALRPKAFIDREPGSEGRGIHKTQSWIFVQPSAFPSPEPGNENESLILSLLADHCLLLHPEQLARFENKLPAITVGSLTEKSKAESIFSLIQDIILSDDVKDKLGRLHEAIEEVFRLSNSKKHMSDRELGRLGPTPSLKSVGDIGKKPNITPYKPDYWEDKIVVSDKIGTHSNDQVCAGDTVYIDYAFTNNGDMDADYFTIEYYINGSRIDRVFYNGILRHGYYYQIISECLFDYIVFGQCEIFSCQYFGGMGKEKSSFSYRITANLCSESDNAN